VRRRAGLYAVVVVVAGLATAPAASAMITVTAGLHADGSRGHIYIARDDGSHKRLIGSGDASAISPNGTRVAVTDYPASYPGSAKFKMYRSSGGAPLFTLNTGLAVLTWAPNSRTLAGVDIDNSRLVTINAATGARTTIAGSSRGAPSFSPDSKRLAYATQGDVIRIVDLATHKTTTLRRHADAPVWGKHGIAFATTHKDHGQTIWDVATIRPNGTHFRQLTHVTPTPLYFGLVPAAWSANGKRLATDTQGSDGYWNTPYVVDAVHGGARLLYHGNLQQTTISHDGRWIIGQTGDAECCGFQYTDIVRVPWDGGEKQVLVRHAMFVSSNR
jgi:WD40 repeat protein